MRQSDIVTRLASFKNADALSAMTIRNDLMSAARDLNGSPEVQREREIIATLVGYMIDQALLYNPGVLPRLLPFFAAVCGDHRDGEDFGDIDWPFWNALFVSRRIDPAHTAR